MSDIPDNDIIQMHKENFRNLRIRNDTLHTFLLKNITIKIKFLHYK